MVYTSAEDYMTAFDWDDSFSVGVRQVDQHNQHLFNLLRKLYKALIEDSDPIRTKLEFSELSEYIVFNFACEEIWMTKTKYSIITGHQEQHMQLRLMFLDIYKHFQHNYISIATMLPRLMLLVVAHIQKSDATYGRA
jgi:hemerythrin